jgi:hypothetical protein
MMQLSREFTEGVAAFKADKPIYENPYTPKTTNYFNWNIGWRYAERNSKKEAT